MAIYLVQQNSDWADEFQCQKYCILEDVSEQDVIEYIKDICKDGAYFGTNEGWEEEELSEDDFSYTEISEEENNLLVKLLGKSFGTGVV